MINYSSDTNIQPMTYAQRSPQHEYLKASARFKENGVLRKSSQNEIAYQYRMGLPTEPASRADYGDNRSLPKSQLGFQPKD